jgi:hypothetical protein
MIDTTRYGAVSVRDKAGKDMPRVYCVTFEAHGVLQLAVMQARTAAAASRQVRRHFAGADVFDVVAA